MTSSEPDDAYAITTRDDEGTTLVTLRGEIDAALRDQASEAMVFVVTQDNPVVADVADVTFIDSSGLAFLVQLHRLCAESGLGLDLRNPSHKLLELLEVLGMGGQFAVQRTAEREILGAGATTT